MMLTRVHLDFWNSKHKPTWSERIKKPYSPSWLAEKSLIDEAVNAHAGIKPSKSEIENSNLINLCRSYRNRGTLRENLIRISIFPYSTDTKKRISLCKKWAKKIKEVGCERN